MRRDPQKISMDNLVLKHMGNGDYELRHKNGAFEPLMVRKGESVTVGTITAVNRNGQVEFEEPFL